MQRLNRTILSVISGAVLLGVCACRGPDSRIDPPVRLQHLSLMFLPGQSLCYRYVSNRTITIDWKPEASDDPNDGRSIQHLYESLDLVVTYHVQAVDVNGLATVEGRFESIDPKRSRLTGAQVLSEDPVILLKGRTFTFRIDPSGRIRDRGAFHDLLEQTARFAFRDDPRRGRLKGPEMVWDVIALLWSPWEVLAGQDPNGVRPGDAWSTQLAVPTPMVLRKARDASCTWQTPALTDGQRVAVIASRYALSPDPLPAHWPIPYAGRFGVSGPFGFLRHYQVRCLDGHGTDRLDMTEGRLLGYEQHYTVTMDASMPLALASPTIVIDQTLRMDPCPSHSGGQ